MSGIWRTVPSGTLLRTISRGMSDLGQFLPMSKSSMLMLETDVQLGEGVAILLQENKESKYIGNALLCP